MSNIYEESTMNDMYFTTIEMKRVFSDANKVQKQMDCEAALASIEAELHIIPQAMADEIIKKSKVEFLNFTNFKQDFKKTGHPFIPLLHAYQNICDNQAGEYVHWGATTQDILDTAMALQLKEAYGVIRASFEHLYSLLVLQAEKYKDVVMVGRTNGQQAMPITFGYKLAVWGFALREDLDRLKEGEDRIFRGSFFGAVGTLASIPENGIEIQEGMLKRLGLTIPAISWSTSRNHYAELINNFALLGATCAKIGNEVYSLQKSEIRELEECQGAGSIGSSTMPHKRNPFRSMEIVALAKVIRGYADIMMNSLELEHERDPRSVLTESLTLEKTCSAIHASVKKTIGLVENLVVYPDNMKRNLEVLHGLIFSEAIMMELGKKVGRQTAHELIHELSMQAFSKQQSLKSLLKKNKVIAEAISAEKIDSLMQAENYVGLTNLFVERLIQQKNGIK